MSIQKPFLKGSAVDFGTDINTITHGLRHNAAPDKLHHHVGFRMGGRMDRLWIYLTPPIDISWYDRLHDLRFWQSYQ